MEKVEVRADTRLILRAFDRAAKIEEAGKLGPNGEVRASYGAIAYNVITDALKDLIVEAPDNPRRGLPTTAGTLKPAVLAIGDAKVLTHVLLNEASLGKLLFIEEVKVEDIDRKQEPRTRSPEVEARTARGGTVGRVGRRTRHRQARSRGLSRGAQLTSLLAPS